MDFMDFNSLINIKTETKHFFFQGFSLTYFVNKSKLPDYALLKANELFQLQQQSY